MRNIEKSTALSRQVKILGIGKYLPSNIISSEKLNEKMCASKGLIQETTGIIERRYIEKETTSYMGSLAAKEALLDASLNWNDIDCIVSASGVPEQAIPCTASLIQKHLGLESSGIPCFDINSTCLSFLTALDLLSHLVEAGKYKNVLIVSSEIASVGLNWDDLESSTLFGDGAAAVIIGKTPADELSKILISNMKTYSEGAEYAQIKALGTKVLPQEYSENNKKNFLFQMDGKNIFRMASLFVPKFVDKLLYDSNLTIEDINMFIPHQASLPAMNLIMKKLDIKKDKFMSIIHNHGNTGGRAPATLHLSRLLFNEGHKIIIAESIRDHICKFSKSVFVSEQVCPPRLDSRKYIEELKNIIKIYSIEILIPTCEEIFYIAKNLDSLTELCDVFIDKKTDLIFSLHHKFEATKIVENFGIKIPDSLLISSIDTLEDVWLQKKIIKPVYSRFGSKVRIIKNKKDIIGLDISENNPWILQEYIEGQQFSTYTIVKDGKILAHTAYLAKHTIGLGTNISFKHFEHSGSFNFIKNFVKKNNFTGQLAFDFIENEKGETFFIECNPRLTSGIHLFNYSNNISDIFFYKTNNIIFPQKSTETMLGFPMLIYGLHSVTSWKKFIGWIKTFLFSKDVIFSFYDISPFFYQFYLFFLIKFMAIKHKISVVEATTIDIEWNGD